MPRAHRYFLPSHVRHITHWCPKKEFLLKFAKDLEKWIKWLFEARKRFGIEILNDVVTSNHIHVLVYCIEAICWTKNSDRKPKNLAYNHHHMLQVHLGLTTVADLLVSGG